MSPATGTQTQIQTQPHHVLLVDDSHGDAFLMESCIELAGVSLQLSVALDGVEALEFLARERQEGRQPELMLLDLNMPRMNGFEVLESLRNTQDYQDLWVVVLTTSNTQIDRARARALGTDIFITKPFGLAETTQLLRKIEAALQGQLPWAELQTPPA
ncbi:response regulator [Deinococcus sp. Marseille-Q6407]|uniref:response regulator n=1 Tax=Deinococcus sp. Marseille-Q6407 TaxID=2969223 RepID=UPI0021BE1CDE|nr:response regulator [Deinococcus sp. Marseille-Q6407]